MLLEVNENRNLAAFAIGDELNSSHTVIPRRKITMRFEG